MGKTMRVSMNLCRNLGAGSPYGGIGLLKGTKAEKVTVIRVGHTEAGTIGVINKDDIFDFAGIFTVYTHGYAIFEQHVLKVSFALGVGQAMVHQVGYALCFSTCDAI